MPKRVLLTGHGGFVGHHCLEYFLSATDWELVCIDSFRHKGTCRRVVEVCRDPRVKTYRHDLAAPIDRQLENLIFERRVCNGTVVSRPIDAIINMASDSAVERSASDPVACLRNNYELAINMLEFARKCDGLGLFIQVSTDEVYGEAPPDGSHREWDVIMPSNPYAASKAAQEAMAISYWRTYGLPVVITNTMNIIGERQDGEKFLPKIISKISMDEEVPIYGDASGIGSRCYLHAKNMADALVFLAERRPTMYADFVAAGRSHEARPDRYNVCGETELDNLQMARMVAEIMGKELRYRMVPSETARPGYDRRYMLDGSKMRELGWKPPMSFRESLEAIVRWSEENLHWVI